MIAGNPDHRDDASQPLSRFIKTFPILMIKVVIDTFTTLHDNWLPALSVRVSGHLVCFTLLVNIFSWHYAGPGAIDHTVMAVMTRSCIMWQGWWRPLMSPRLRNTGDIVIRTRLLIVTEFLLQYFTFIAFDTLTLMLHNIFVQLITNDFPPVYLH